MAKPFNTSRFIDAIAVVFFVLLVIALCRTPVNQDPVGDLPPVELRP